MTKHKKAKKAPSDKSRIEDWVASLAKQVTDASTSTKAVKSKKERIEHRNAKKRRREERKGIDSRHRAVRVESRMNNEGHPIHSRHGQKLIKASGRRTFLTNEKSIQEKQVESNMILDNISSRIEDIVNRVHSAEDVSDTDVTDTEKKRDRQKYFTWKPYVSKESGIQGKAVSGQQLSTEVIQPRKRDYSGLGFVRPSLFLDLRDESFLPLFEEEFAEHIPGFYGKQRTNAMKKQLDGGMLWRRLQKQREGGNDTVKKSSKDTCGKIPMSQKVNGKRLSDMTPDERVDAMIKLGLI